MESLETDMVGRGMKITENLSTMLGKRKHQQTRKAQRNVSRLVEMTGTINHIVRKSLRVVDDDESEPEEDQP